jgi:hypothetical protein
MNSFDRASFFSTLGPAAAALPLAGGAANGALQALGIRSDATHAATATTVLIAAADALPRTKAFADEVCTGTNDEAKINSALLELAARGGGSLLLSEGTFNIDAEIRSAASGKRWPNRIVVRGQGRSTILQNRMDGGGVNDKYVMQIWGDASDHVDYVGLFDFSMAGQEYLANTKGQHGIMLKAVDWVVADNLYVETMSEEGYVFDTVRNVVAGRLFAKNMGSSLCDIAVTGTRYVNIEQLVGEKTNQVEATTACVYIGANATSEPELINIGSISAIMPGSAGLYINSASDVNIGKVSVVGETGTAPKTRQGIKINQATGKYQAHNINISEVVLRSCGANAYEASLDLVQVEYVNIGQAIVEGAYGYGLRCQNLRRANFAQVIMRDRRDDTPQAWDAIFLGPSTTDVTLQQVQVHDWVSVPSNCAGIHINGAKRTIVGSAVLSNVDWWDIRVTSTAENTIIESAVLSGHGSGGLNDAGVNTRIGKLIQGVNGANYKPFQSGGTGTIASGATSVVVDHGLAFTPSARNVFVTPTSNSANDPGTIWVDAFTPTQFTVRCRTDPGEPGLSFAWHALPL